MKIASAREKNSSFSWPLKFISLLLVLSVIGSLFSLNGHVTILFGFMLSGIPAIVSVLVLQCLVPVILLFGLWKKTSWTWNLGLGYFGFLSLSTLISTSRFIFIALDDLLATTWPSLIFALMVGLVLGLIAFYFWHERTRVN